ncbi:MAG: hypothetical protein CMK44_01005 [Porticoccus sp.]|nr:hypothetical protein [Porticoccus sp.]|tara:strand:+ start:461 stop:940 length:480 start_codon:yes stop_codon:yes gene_type:complete
MSEEDCGICGLELSDKFPYTLNCGHKFHYECLMKSFNNISYTINSKKNNQCPYCRKNSECLPLVNGLKKVIPGVHCNINSSSIDDKKQELKEKYSQKCGYTLTRGKNKGDQCGKNCVLGYGYCKIHLEKMKSKHGNLISDLSLPTSNDIQQTQQTQQIQ